MRKILHNINFYIQIKNVIDFLSKMYPDFGSKIR